ncbi:MAG: sigma-70 family RNA polymerase sigma factor [Planctomycetota bacterium]
MDHQRPFSPDDWIELLPWLEALAQRLVADPGAAADLAQETALVATRTSGVSLDSSRAWLRRVLWNRVLRHRRVESRRRERERTAARTERELTDADSARSVERAEVARNMLTCVLALPEPYRGTLIEHFLEGRSLAQIARARDLPAATVRSQLRRGLEKLRHQLTGSGGEGGAARDLFALVGPLLPDRSTADAAVALAEAPSTAAVWTKALGAAAGALVLGAVFITGLRTAKTDGTDAAYGLDPVLRERDASGRAPAGRAETSARAALAPARQPIAVPPAATAVPRIFGRVIDEEGAAVVGAEVLFSADRGHVFPIDARPSAGSEARAPAPERTSTDAAGRFELPHPGVGPLLLAVRSRGFAPHASSALRVFDRGGVELAPIVLRPGLAVEGRVLDADGFGVEGAVIDQEFTRDAGYFAPDARAYRRLTVTDVGGRFTLRDLAPGPLDLRVTHAAQLPVFVATTVPSSGSDGLRIAFPAATTIEGQCLGAEPDVPLHVRFSGGPSSARREYRLGSVPCDADGRFRIPVPATPEGLVYRLTPVVYFGRTSSTWAEARKVRAGARDVTFDRIAHATLALRAVDEATGRGLTDLRVRMARGHLGAIQLSGRGRVVDPARGAHVFRPVPVAKVDVPQQLIVGAAGYRSVLLALPELSSGTTTDLGTLELQAAAGRSVSVLGPDGAPAEGAAVTVQLPDALSAREVAQTTRRSAYVHRSTTVPCEPDGNARIHPPEGALFYVHASAPGFPPQEPLMVLAGDGRIQLRLAEGSTLDVFVQDADGRPVEGHAVSLTLPDRSTLIAQRDLHFEAYSDRAGVARFNSLPAGDGRVRAGDTEIDAVVPASGRAVVSVTGRRAATPRGIVELDDTPLAGARIELHTVHADGATSLRSTSDARADGSFTLEPTGPGPVVLAIEHPDLALGARVHRVLEREAVPWDIELESMRVAGRVSGPGGSTPTGGLVCLVRAEHLTGATRELARMRAPSFDGAAVRRLDASGAFEWAGAICGDDCILLAVHADSGLKARPLRIGAGLPTTGLELTLPRAASLTLDVDITGLPVQSGYVPCSLTLTPLDGPAAATGRRHTRPGADGAAAFRRLAPGTWRLEVSTDGPGSGSEPLARIIELTPGEERRIGIRALP